MYADSRIGISHGQPHTNLIPCLSGFSIHALFDYFSLWAVEGLWEDIANITEDFKKCANNLAGLFEKNFKEFESKCSADVIAAGPKVE